MDFIGVLGTSAGKAFSCPGRRNHLLLSGDDHDAKSRFVVHHSPVGLLGLGEWKGFDHRAYALERAEREGVFAVDR